MNKRLFLIIVTKHLYSFHVKTKNYVVGEVSDRLELMECLYGLNPNIVIIYDGDTNGTGNLETISLINQIAIDTKVLLVVDEYDEEKEFTALNMWVTGFLLKRVGRIDFIRCIRAVNNGEMWVRRRVMEKLVQQLLAANAPSRKRVKRG